MFDGSNKAKIIQTLESYKKLTSDTKNHWLIIQDKTVLLYTSTLLECDDRRILNTCLDILEDIIANESNHEVLVGTLGIFESLESLSIRSRSGNERLSERCGALADLLRKSAPPAYRTRSRNNAAAVGTGTTRTAGAQGKHHQGSSIGGPTNRRAEINNKLYQLYIEDMNKTNIWKIEQTLSATKGIISFIIDDERKRITIRVTTKLKVENIAKRISKNCNLVTLAVKRSLCDNREIYVDILNTDKNMSMHYFPEEEDEVLPSEGAVKLKDTIKKNASEWLKSAYKLWNTSVY